jgi:5S rRNA maturation endonuclease (ribonuclease M5)
MYARKCDLNSIAKVMKITMHKVKCHLELQDIFENFIPLEYRLDAVKAVIEGENVTKTAEIFGVSEHKLKSWLNQYTETKTIKMSSEDKILGDGDYDGLMIRKALEEYFISRDLEATADKLNIVPSSYIRRWGNLLAESIKNKSAERFFISLQDAETVVEEDPSNQAENTDVLFVPISPITLSQLIEEESVPNLLSQSPQDVISQLEEL